MNKTELAIPALLTTKVAIVTGASRGLGAQIATQMAVAGAIVRAMGRSVGPVERGMSIVRFDALP